MALPGETISNGASPRCCGKVLKIQVLQSGAGYYIGTYCPHCGPYSRESLRYYATRKEAVKELQNDTYERR